MPPYITNLALFAESFHDTAVCDSRGGGAEPYVGGISQPATPALLRRSKVYKSFKYLNKTKG